MLCFSVPRIPSEQPASDNEPDVQHKKGCSGGEADLREQREPIHIETSSEWNISMPAMRCRADFMLSTMSIKP